jgi:drug/metabolite transporter (DMT)-like permease
VVAAPVTERHIPHIRAYLALGVGILSLASSAILVRWAQAPGIVTSFYRVAIATGLMAWPFLRGVRAGGTLPRRGIQFAFLGGLFFAADLAFWTTGVVLSGATNPTLLANTAPLWVGMGALVFFGERLNAAFWGGLILALSGVLLILGLDALRAASLGLGSLLGLLASIFYGGYFLITQQGRETLDSITYFWIAALGSTLGLLLVCVVFRQPLTGYPLHSYVTFLGMGLVNQILGYLAINYALGQLPASVVAPTMLGQPVVTALLAWPLLGEGLVLWQVFGGTAVLVGVYVVHHSRRGIPDSVAGQANAD